MLSFELTAIDLILVIAVIVLLVLYITKLANSPEQFLKQSMSKYGSPEKVESKSQEYYLECPRGFGKIRKFGNDGSVSERCLGCYKIMECYGESKKGEFQVSSF